MKKRMDGGSFSKEVLHIPLFSEQEILQTSPHVCAICEHGGKLVICDGPCHRQFHYVVGDEAPGDSCPCVVLPANHAGKPWFCPNCNRDQAMCYGCRTVGPSPEVVRKCPKQFCVRFYCFHCLLRGDASCQLHTCITCHQSLQGEMVKNMVQCLRCPKAWHTDCLQMIKTKGFARDREIWDHEAHGQERKMFYCPDHPIDPDLKTPSRDHISWI